MTGVVNSVEERSSESRDDGIVLFLLNGIRKSATDFLSRLMLQCFPCKANFEDVLGAPEFST